MYPGVTARKQTNFKSAVMFNAPGGELGGRICGPFYSHNAETPKLFHQKGQLLGTTMVFWRVLNIARRSVTDSEAGNVSPLFLGVQCELCTVSTDDFSGICFAA